MSEFIPFSVGRYGVDVIWIALIGYTFFKTFKRKQWVWFTIFVFNFLFGLILPAFLSVILPIIYHIIYRNYDEDKKKKGKSFKIKYPIKLKWRWCWAFLLIINLIITSTFQKYGFLEYFKEEPLTFLVIPLTIFLLIKIVIMIINVVEGQIKKRRKRDRK